MEPRVVVCLSLILQPLLYIARRSSKLPKLRGIHLCAAPKTPPAIAPLIILLEIELAELGGEHIAECIMHLEFF